MRLIPYRIYVHYFQNVTLFIHTLQNTAKQNISKSGGFEAQITLDCTVHNISQSTLSYITVKTITANYPQFLVVILPCRKDCRTLTSFYEEICRPYYSFVFSLTSLTESKSTISLRRPRQPLLPEDRSNLLREEVAS